VILNEDSNVHDGQPVLGTGTAIEDAEAAMIMVHGRGASAQDILGLTAELNVDGVACIAPQAANNTWYPYSFLEPFERNEPYLSSALKRIGDLVTSVEENGVPAQKIVLLGFSQGACLISEFSARNAQRFGGICGLSGGLIGPLGRDFNYDGSLDGTPVFLGCSDVDFHIPVDRVYETERVMRNLGGDVTAQIYPGMGHTINRDEIAHVQQILDGVLMD
jgi:phospholipase/carboxylesterase